MSAGSAAHRCAHIKGEKLGQWPYVGTEFNTDFFFKLVVIQLKATVLD